MIDFNTFLEALEEYRKNPDGPLPQDVTPNPPVTKPTRTEQTTASVVANSNQAKSLQPQIDQGCAFCISNKERPAIYKSHSIKDEQGKVTCPVLRAYVCPLCSATGDNAHTIRYCQRTAVGARTSGFLRTPRNSAGRVIRQQKP